MGSSLFFASAIHCLVKSFGQSPCAQATEPQQAELVKLRYFVGLKIVEAAEVLGISEATAKRWWAFARAWLFNEIQLNPDG